MTDPKNHLMELLPRRDRQRLLARCERVELQFDEMLYEPGNPTRHAYFPTGGFVSLIASTDDGPGLEVGMIGKEGLVGVHLVLGVSQAPLSALVQGGGPAWRIGETAFRAELAASVPMQRHLNRYVYVLMRQLAASAGCLRFHQIGPRLARWLLMSRDRAGADQFRVTQEFLAYMLGVRRVGVTAAAGALQRAGLITYHRGQLTVLDPTGLATAACSCYAADLRNYDAIFPLARRDDLDAAQPPPT